MLGKAIPGGTIAITHNDKVIYERGFGYSDAAKTIPMQETALMRRASVSKPITASAIHQLAKDGRLDLNAKVFNISGNGGILNVAPYNGVLGDSRLRDITIQQLLEHKGGWNRDTAGDLAFQDVQIANAMGLPSPPGIANSAVHLEPPTSIHSGHAIQLLEHWIHVLGNGGGSRVPRRIRIVCRQPCAGPDRNPRVGSRRRPFLRGRPEPSRAVLFESINRPECV